MQRQAARCSKVAQHRTGAGPHAERAFIERCPEERFEARDMQPPALRLQRRQSNGLVLRRPDGASAKPVEQGVDACVGPGRAKQAHYLSRGSCGRQFPAGFVEHAYLLALEQGAHAAHQRPVLRDQRDWLVSAPQVFEHRGRGGGGFVFETIANSQAWSMGAVEQPERLVFRRVSIDQQAGHRGVALQTCAECVRATGLHHDPGRRLQRKEAVGDRRRRKAGPLKCDSGEQPRTRSRPSNRRELLACSRPMRRPLCRWQRSRGPRDRMARGHHMVDRLLEPTRVTPSPGRAPGLRAQ
jgi:hypothetical protein